MVVMVREANLTCYNKILLSESTIIQLVKDNCAV